MDKKTICDKLDKVIEALEEYLNLSVGVASQSTVPIGYSAKVKPELYYVVKDKAGKIGWIKGSDYDSSINRIMWKYGALADSSMAQRFADEAESDQYKGRPYNKHEYDYNPFRKYKNFSDSLDYIKEMAREDAEFYRNKENNPNNLSVEELAAKCYEERVKYPSDEAQDAFYGEFMRTFN